MFSDQNYIIMLVVYYAIAYIPFRTLFMKYDVPDDADERWNLLRS